MTVDDARKPFPELELAGEPVPDDENGFVVIQEMMDRFPIGEDDEIDGLQREVLDGKGPGTPEWNDRARQVVERWSECLAKCDEMLARPGFVPPLPDSYAEAMSMEGEMELLAYCRQLARLLSLKSKLDVGQGRPEQALRTARKCVEFGLMLYSSADTLITHLVGHAVMAIGLEDVRKVARSAAVTPALLRPEIETLALLPSLERGMVCAIGGEFAYLLRMLEGVKKLQWYEALEPTGRVGPPWPQQLVKEVPFIKLNMTHNLLGGYLNEIAGALDHYQPPARGPRAAFPHSLWASQGFVHFVRNPVGEILLWGCSCPPWA